MNRKKTAYISGKITGTTDYENRFTNAEKKLKGMRYNVVNPLRRTAHLVGKHKTMGLPSPEWSDYMKECLQALLFCDTIYMLRGWEDSKDAKLERHVAGVLGMEILEEE